MIAMIKVFLILISFVFINSCSASYEKLKTYSYSGSDTFSKNLLEFYKKNAEFEAKKMHDWNSAKLYSEKALSAAEGKEIKPQKIKYWKLPKENISELNISYENLMSIYNEAKVTDPYNLARAISSLDCWAEQQEENWQTWDINNCKNDYLNSMHEIYKKIIDDKKNKQEKNAKQEKENNNSVSVVTTSKKNEVMQIIYFDFDKSNLSNVSINTIKKFILKNNEIISNYIIIGHTDTKGSKEYNYNLSLKRAEVVKKIFINEGIKEENLTILGKGENFLAVQTSDDVKHPANRRAEIIKAN